MTFQDLFQQVVAGFPVGQFLQALYVGDTAVQVTIGPRADANWFKVYDIADRDAFATTVAVAVTDATTITDAFVAALPEPTSTVLPSRSIAADPTLDSSVTAANAATGQAPITEVPEGSTVTPDTPVAATTESTETAQPAADTTAPADQS